MIRYFLRSLGSHFRSGRSLFLLSVLGVALGVASALSIQIINLNALGAFEGSMRAVSGEADLTVLPLAPALDERVYPVVLADPAVALAWPVCRTEVALEGRDNFFLEIVGLDLFQPVRVPWDEPPSDIGRALAVPGWAALSPALARDLGVSTGDALRVTSGSRIVELHVGATVDFAKMTPLAGSRLVVMDIAQVQDLFGLRGRLAQIDVVLREGTDPDAARAGLQARIGPGARVVTPPQRREEAANLLGAFRLNLTALSLISLFVGGFLVYVSTQASLLRRRNEIGLLRSIGMTRGQTIVLLLAEVGLLGTIGVLAGIPLGYAAARANISVVSGTLTNLYMLEEIETLRLPLWLWAAGAVMGIGGAMTGALVPALDISRRNTRRLLVSYTIRESLGAAAPRLLALGVGILAATGAVLVLAGADWKPGGFVVAVGLLVGLPLTAPWVVARVTRLLHTRRFGLAYGIRALGLRLQTTAFSVAALGVAVSMLIGITLMIGSFRRTVEIWIDATVHADVYVTTESWRRARESAVLDPDLVARIAAQPGVEHVDRLRQLFATTGGRRISLAGVEMGLPLARDRFQLVSGDPAAATERVLREGAVLISEPLARKEALAPGDDLLVSGPGGAVRFPIAGVYYDYSSELGGAAMDLKTLETAFGPGPVNNVALYLSEGSDAGRFVDRLKAELAGLPLLIRSNRDLRREVFEIFDQTFAVTKLLQAMALLIAASGITLTLIVLARERVSELALYRALGASRAQIFRVFLGKGLGIALFGLALGSVGGLILALILVYVINRAWFGWTIALHWPLSSLIWQAVTILAAAVLASLYPALRASRTPATELSNENL